MPDCCNSYGICEQGHGCPVRATPTHRTHYKPEPETAWPLRLLDLAIVIALVALICCLLGVVGPALDARAGEYQESQSLVDAQRAAVLAFKKDMAAAKLCRETHGESLIRWTAGGELVCVPRHSKQAVRLASNP